MGNKLPTSTKGKVNRQFNSGVFGPPRKKDPKDVHDGLHMPEWSNTGACYCMNKCCWESPQQTVKGKCICKDCICGGFNLTLHFGAA